VEQSLYQFIVERLRSTSAQNPLSVFWSFLLLNISELKLDKPPFLGRGKPMNPNSVSQAFQSQFFIVSKIFFQRSEVFDFWFL